MKPFLSSVNARLRAVPRGVLHEWLLLLFVLCGAGVALARFEVLAPLDALWYDAIVASHPLPVPRDIALIKIDPDTLDASDLSRRTWTRADSAALLERLAQGKPKAVLLDIHMPVSDPRDRAADQRLGEAIRNKGNIVLPMSFVEERAAIRRFQLPSPRFSNFAAALGHDRVATANDRVARRVPLALTNGEIEWPHVVLPLLELAKETPALPSAHNAADIDAWIETRYLYLRFIARQAQFDTYSARQVMNGEVAPQIFDQKIVLIGAANADAAAAVPGRVVWGLEVSANALNTLRHEAWPRAATPLASGIATGAFVVFMLAAYLLLADRHAFALTVSAAVAVLLASWLLLIGARVWFAPAAFVAIAALAYPLWAWRRLAATYRFVGAELQRMRSEPGVVVQLTANNDAQPSLLIDQQLIAIQEATSKLRAARKFVTDTLQGLPIGVLVSDAHGNVMLANDACLRMLGRTAVEVEQQSLRGVLGDWGTANGTPLHAIDIAGTPSIECQPPRAQHSADQLPATFWLGASPLTNELGAAIGAIVAMTDISPLRQAQTQREQLLRFVSHDMRSPLASILALIELRRESPHDSDDDTRFADVAQYARYALGLAEEFLQLAYASASDPQEFAEVDLVSAVETALSVVRPLARERGVSFQTCLPDIAPLRGNVNLLARLLGNVLHNAVKFSPARGVITIDLQVNAHQWVCRVHDQGPGLDAADLQQRFDPNGRSGGGKISGMGLGLAFVNVVAAKHGGSVDIARGGAHKQAGDAGGTTVTITLPRTAFAFITPP